MLLPPLLAQTLAGKFVQGGGERGIDKKDQRWQSAVLCQQPVEKSVEYTKIDSVMWCCEMLYGARDKIRVVDSENTMKTK